MDGQTAVVGLIGLVVAAVLLRSVWRLVTKGTRGGCSCDRSDCPYRRPAAGAPQGANGANGANGTQGPRNPEEAASKPDAGCNSRRECPARQQRAEK